MYNPYPNSPYSTLGNSRNQFMQPQQQSQQQQYDFSGWGDRLTSIEQGIKGLTEHFKNINVPGAEVGEGAPAPEYAGNTAPAPLAAAPVAPLDAAPVDTGFNFGPSGGSLMSQLSSAYGGQTHNEQIGRGPAGFTQGFADFFTGEGYYADPRGTYADGPWSISETPITLGSRFGTKGEMTLDPYGNPQGAMQDLQPRSPTLNNLQPPGPKANPFQYQGRPNDMQQPLQQGAGGVGAGINGLASLLSQKGSTI